MTSSSSETSSDDLIHKIVQLQRSSPDFAELCVANVTSPSHKFLFSIGTSDERRRYTTALMAADARERQQQSGGSAEEMRSRFFRPTFADGLRDRSSFVAVSLNDAKSVWRGLRDVVASRVRVDGTLTSHAHAPHVFARRGDLVSYIQRVLRVAESQDGHEVEMLVRFMMQRLTMTETFLFVLSYLVAQLLHASWCCSRWANSHKRPRDDWRAANDTTASNKGDDDVCRYEQRYREAAATIFFAAAALLNEHKPSPPTHLFYCGAFSRYLVQLVEHFVRHRRCANDHDSSFSFVSSAAAAWIDENILEQRAVEALKKLRVELAVAHEDGHDHHAVVVG